MSQFNIIRSSGGVDANGKPVITPVSVLSFTVAAEGHSRVHDALATDTVRCMICPLWAREIADICLPDQSILDHVPMHPALIRHWLTSVTVGGLFFPRAPLDMQSKDPCIRIEKRPGGGTPPPSCTRVNLTLYFFPRTIETSPALQPFDPAVWRPEAYAAWVRMHSDFAVALEEECADFSRLRVVPCGGVCEYFRRIMRTHFADFGLVFGGMWWDFGLRAMVGADLYDFMREALMRMFVVYQSGALPPLPPLFSPVTMGSGQRICAKCLIARLGNGRMMRCGRCKAVYYCSAVCQKADWKAHRAVCSERAD